MIESNRGIRGCEVSETLFNGVRTSFSTRLVPLGDTQEPLDERLRRFPGAPLISKEPSSPMTSIISDSSYVKNATSQRMCAPRLKERHSDPPQEYVVIQFIHFDEWA